MKTLVTGSAGFIGYHVVNRLINSGNEVIGLDIINDYYDINIKYKRLSNTGICREKIRYGEMLASEQYPNYQFIKLKLEDREELQRLFAEEGFDTVVNLAAQAGVRYSITNPYAYLDSNLIGFLNLLECCRHNQIKHFTFASSSSVYGLNEKMPLSTQDNVDHPISLYAATKKSNELIAHAYSHLYGIPTTGLRFFTVYGPWGRPDMALFIFTEAILKGKPIKVFNFGQMLRDFTYIDDIVEGVFRVVKHPPGGNPEWSGLLPDPSSSVAPYKIYNIGNQSPVKLLDFISAIEKALGKKAEKIMLPLQAGDVPATKADVADLVECLGYKPSTSVEEGIEKFVRWYKTYYSLDLAVAKSARV